MAQASCFSHRAFDTSSILHVQGGEPHHAPMQGGASPARYAWMDAAKNCSRGPQVYLTGARRWTIKPLWISDLQRATVWIHTGVDRGRFSGQAFSCWEKHHLTMPSLSSFPSFRRSAQVTRFPLCPPLGNFSPTSLHLLNVCADESAEMCVRLAEELWLQACMHDGLQQRMPIGKPRKGQILVAELQPFMAMDKLKPCMPAWHACVRNFSLLLCLKPKRLT